MDSDIQEITNRLIATYRPRAIYLFGSRAWGTADTASDIDLLIVVDRSDEPMHRRPIATYRALKGLRASKDILVLTRDEFEETAGDPSSLCALIRDKGIRLHEAA